MEAKQNKILAIVVTYNRLELLKECLEALCKTKCEKKTLDVLIVDNASTDKTREYLEDYTKEKQNVYFIRLSENSGGAGGFCEGIRYGLQREYDYLWLMDDDTIVQQESLHSLLQAADFLQDDFGYLASHVVWTDGTPSMMNEVSILERGWNRHVKEVAAGLLPIQRATFVSLLLRANVVKDAGLPIKEFFIWSDDHEYTQRIAKKYTNYYVADSIVVHKMLKNVGSDLATDDDARLTRYYYAFRNEYYVASKNGKSAKLRYYWRVFNVFRRIIKNAKNMKLRRIKILIQGVSDGWKFHPIIEKWEQQ